MSNPKSSFIYYSVDTDRYQDIKIKRLKKKHKCCGIAVYDYVLCEIYRTKGYYIVWDDMTLFDVADYFELPEDTVTEIITFCAEIGLFNYQIFTKNKSLTSSAIQRRFEDWSKKAKRTDFKLHEKYKIIQEECEIISESSGKDDDCTGKDDENTGSLPGSKVKESKVPESKVLLAAATEGSDLKEIQNPIAFPTWRQECSNFLKDEYFKKNFCENKKMPLGNLELLMKEFITDLNLKNDFKNIAALKTHFVRHYDKHYKNGTGAFSKGFVEVPENQNYDEMEKW